MGVFKVDWALDAPIPWTADACTRAATVHVGGTLEEIAASERAAWEGRHAERPFVLLAQHTPFDPSRAPAGQHTAWGYCHVPHGSGVDMLPRIEAQVERFAPGFRDRILARHVMPPAALERHNPNYVGGDIAAGVPDARQLVARPTLSHYSTPGARPVSLLGIDAARRGGAWDVRLPRGPARPPRGAAGLKLNDRRKEPARAA